MRGRDDSTVGPHVRYFSVRRDSETSPENTRHITPTLRDTLHWLPVSQRITFKIALMTYDCIHGRSPAHFCDICSPIVSVPFRFSSFFGRPGLYLWLSSAPYIYSIVPVPFRFRLRSADNEDMIVPRTRTALYGPRSLRVAAPQIWSMQPPHFKNISVRREQFKSSLKTWLFVQAYS